MKRDPEDTPPKNAESLSRRELLKSGGGAGLVGVAATTLAGGLLPPEEAEAVDPDPGPSGAVHADDSRKDLGGSPILDEEPFGEANAMVLPPLRERVLALKNLLAQRNVIPRAPQSPDGMDQVPPTDLFVQFYESVVGPQYGKMVVAHAWTNPAFREQLLHPPEDRPFAATGVVAKFLESRLRTGQIPQAARNTLGPEGEWLRVVANGLEMETGKQVHNLVSCTACSCYPAALLGIQPVWYKSRQYRARSIGAPRGVLREFAQAEDEKAREENRPAQAAAQLEAYLEGIDEIRVHDSNSEVRYLVLPSQPKEWVGLSEEELCKRITRNSMVGVAIC